MLTPEIVLEYIIHMTNGKLDARQIGERIRRLRRQMNLTQAELAARVGIRTGAMNYLENGHHLPSLPVLNKLTVELRTGLDALVSGPDPARMVLREEQATYGSGSYVHSEDTFSAPVQTYTAGRARMVRFDPPKADLDEATLRTLDTLLNAFLALEDICGVQKRAAIPLTLQRPLTESGLIRFTAQVRTLFGVNAAVIFDYLELFENAGLRVIILPLPERVESVTYYDRISKNAFFFVAEGATVERQIFRLCYGLGRVYLYNGGMLGERARIGTLDCEHAARRFAALFLMPEEAVATTVHQVGVAPSQWSWELLLRLKHRFGVSAEAFLYRLKELELITPALSSELKTRIYSHYETSNWSEPDNSRRIPSPNGRLGDLLISAALRRSPELPDIRQTLDAAGVRT